MSRNKINQYRLSSQRKQIDRIIEALKLLELYGILGSFKRIAEIVIKNHKTPYDFLEFLLEKEILLKEDNRVIRWIAQAHLPWLKTLEDFDFSFQPSIDQSFIYELSSGRFIDQGKNIVFFGPPGVGKTHLSIALGIEVINQGYDARFLMLNELIDLVIKIDTDFIRKQRLMITLLRPKLLILDDIDYYTTNDSTSEFLFKLIIQRHHLKLPIIFTSNKDFDEWKRLFGHKQRSGTAVDRIVERVEIIEIDGKSYRLKDKNIEIG